MTTKTITNRGGDFLLHMESSAKNLVSGRIENATASIQALAEVVGYPLKAGTGVGLYKLVLESDATANVIAFIVSGKAIVGLAATTGVTAVVDKYVIINAGPGVVNSNKFPAKDATAVAFSTVVLATAAAAIDLKVIAEPTKSTTQAT